MWYLLLLLNLEILLFIIAFGLANGDIMAPSVIMCIMFIISTIFALINVNVWSSVQYKIETVIIIASGIFVYVSIENLYKLLFARKSTRKPNDIEMKTIQDDKIDVPIYYLRILLFLNIFVIFWYYKEIVRIVTSLGMSTSNIFADFRRVYTRLNVAYESSDVEMVSTLLSQFMKLTKGAGYICLYILITYVVSKERKGNATGKHIILLLVNIFLSVIPSLMLAGRNDLLQLVVAGLVYYYIIWHRYNGWNRSISWKYIKWGMGIIVVGIPSFYGMLFLVGRSTTKSMLEYASIYIGSSIALFNEFLIDPVDPPEVFGEETLLGIHQVLYRIGIPTHVKNRHLEFRSLNNFTSSNVYSFFRRPIHDFGIGGMLVFTALVSLFFAWLYFKRIRGVYVGRKLDYRIITYGYLFYWIIYTSIDQRSISMLSASTLVTFLIMYLELVLVKKIRFRRHPRE